MKTALQTRSIYVNILCKDVVPRNNVTIVEAIFHNR